MKILFFAVLFGLIAVAAPSYASPDMRAVALANIPKLNREVSMSQADFEAQTKIIEDVPLGNNYLAFRVRLGKDWTKLNVMGGDVKAGLSKQILGDVTEYLGPPELDLRSSFRIRANDLSFDVTAKDWFLSYVFNNNYNLQGMDVSSEKGVQAQYVMIEDGVQSVVRAVVQISGPRVIMAEYIVPVELWNKEKNMAKRSMATFQLTNFDPSQVELQETFSFVDIAKFSYPVSWILKSLPISSIERMTAYILDLKGGAIGQKNNSSTADLKLMDGRIDVSIVTKNPTVTLQKELDNLKSDLADKGLVLGELIEPIEGFRHHEAIVFSKIEAYKVNNEKGKLVDYEEWIGVFETPGRFYFVRLLTVGRQNNFLTWARNVQAYKTVIGSLSPVVKDDN